MHNHVYVEIPLQSSIFMRTEEMLPNLSVQLQPWINPYVQSFFPETIKLWNLLPEVVVSCEGYFY